MTLKAKSVTPPASPCLSPQRDRRFAGPKECRNQLDCTEPNCPYKHPEGWIPKEDCLYGAKCNRRGCKKVHTCKFDRKCQRKNCKFRHPNGRLIDEDGAVVYCIFGDKCDRSRCTMPHRDDDEVPETDSGHGSGDEEHNCESHKSSKASEKEAMTRKEAPFSREPRESLQKSNVPKESMLSPKSIVKRPLKPATPNNTSSPHKAVSSLPLKNYSATVDLGNLTSESLSSPSVLRKVHERDDDLEWAALDREIRAVVDHAQLIPVH